MFVNFDEDLFNLRIKFRKLKKILRNSRISNKFLIVLLVLTKIRFTDFFKISEINIKSKSISRHSNCGPQCPPPMAGGGGHVPPPVPLCTERAWLYSMLYYICSSVIHITRAVARTYFQGGGGDQAEVRGGQANCKNISMYIV